MLDWFRKITGIKPNPSLSGTDAASEFLARAGWVEPNSPTPAWALMFRSPYETPDAATSWLGGIPHAPSNFVWPNDIDGKPLHFIAQIDLETLKPEPTTGLRPPGLPEKGALLVFIGRSYACKLLSAEDMKRAGPLSLPAELEPIRELGFYRPNPTFSQQPIDIIPFLDADGGRPPFLPDPFEHPRNWITTCGIAALEAKIVIETLERDLKDGVEFFDHIRAKGEAHLPRGVVELKKSYYSILKENASAALSELRHWYENAQRNSGEAPVDPDKVDALFIVRQSLHDKLKETFPLKFLLPGQAKKVWEKIRLDYQEVYLKKDFDVIPPGLRPFAIMWLTDWRGHRLFGIERPFDNNSDDRRGKVCLISISSDPMLDTTSEHDYGMSIWIPRNRILKGRLDNGAFIRHNAV